MTLQLFYPLSKEQQFTDDASMTRGIAFTTKLPDGSLCYSIRTSDEMAKNLVIMPCTDWKELTSPLRNVTEVKPEHLIGLKSLASVDLGEVKFVSSDAIKNCNPMPILNGRNSNINNLYPVTENPPLL